MTQRTVLELILERYGEEVTCNGATVRAVIQPLRKTSPLAGSLPEEYCDQTHFLYTGPAGKSPKAGDVLNTARRNYTVQRADTYLLNGEEIYAWAVLKPLALDAGTAVTIAAQGVTIATALSCVEKALQESEPVSAWGEPVPAAVAAGTIRYELILRNIRPVKDSDLYAAADFTVTVAREGRKVIYSGCRWKTLCSSGQAGERTVRTMELYAAARTEQKEEDSHE
ncbi:MAG: hypothetical protein E7518_02740 [Ruminococcaceae bacterium]|nr:hypothetical protein [Oscillospiraceae bacterium]